MQEAANAVHLDSRRVRRILGIQAIATALLSAAVLFWGPTAALSALLGGVIATTGNAIFALWVFGRYRAQDPGRLVMRFYGAELLKIVAILLMFGAVFYWLESIMPALFLGAFFICQVLPPMLAHGLGD